jgi:cation transport ATPase
MNSSFRVEESPTKTSELGQKRSSSELNEPVLGANHEEHGHGVDWAELARISFVALAAAAVWFRLWEPFTHISVIGVAATLIGGYPIFKEAFENVVERKMTMELSMTIALFSALAMAANSRSRLVLENYTFLTLGIRRVRTNVHADLRS